MERQVVTSGGKWVARAGGGAERCGEAGRELRAAGAQYAVVGVIGCQSGGKSTLLNELFGTRFPVLDTKVHGRRQTTQGIWLAYAEAAGRDRAQHPLVVLDVEGTDSRERGEGARTFESCSTLFVLTICDVIFLNIWFHDLGRYQASNFELLQLVFAEARALRRSKPTSSAGSAATANAFDKSRGERANLVIVVRDVENDVDLAEIRTAVTTDIAHVWRRSQSPSDASTGALEDHFDLHLVVLPHKIYCEHEFEQSVRKVRDAMFFGGEKASGISTLPPNPIVQTRDCCKIVPLDAFERIASMLWTAVADQIKGCDGTQDECSAVHRLDVPHYAILAAQFHCGQLVRRVMSTFDRGAEDLRATMFAQWDTPLQDFHSRCVDLCRAALSEYERESSSYSDNRASHELRTAAAQKRAQLRDQLEGVILELREKYVASCRYCAQSDFDSEFGLVLGGGEHFERNARRISAKSRQHFAQALREAKLPPELESKVDLSRGDAAEFETYMRDQVDERRRTGQALLPLGADGRPISAESIANAGRPKRAPWWRSLLIRAAILGFNYWQATRGQRDARRRQRRFELDHPMAPYF